MAVAVLRQLKQALSTLNPKELREQAERPLRVGLVAASDEELGEMEQFFAPAHFSPERRAEAVQNAVCCACAAVARLAELNKLDLCYPSVLARYAVAQTNVQALSQQLQSSSTEAVIQRALKRVLKGRTSFVIASSRTWAARVQTWCWGPRTMTVR